MREPRTPREDDGRIIADMSQVGRPSLFGGLTDGSKQEERRPQEPQTAWPYPDAPFTPREKRLFVFAALKAALLIGLAFLVGLGLVIAALLAFWNLF